MSGSLYQATPEGMALYLLQLVSDIEGKSLSKQPSGNGKEATDRKWLLDAYVECLKAVNGKRYVGPHPSEQD